jgi:hypothetical protein
MKEKAVENLINIIRNLRNEDFSGPNINTGSSSGTPGFSASSEPSGPVAGVDPVLDGRSRYMRRLPAPYRKLYNKKKKKNK